jgi:serine/threonine protein kinase/tetratricopeptide (TPR) repeat protein
MGCLEENTLFDFLRGALDADSRGAVTRHADECAACRRMLAAAAAELREPPVETTNQNAVSVDRGLVLSRGAAVGRYVILDLLGQGGMGVVYSAFDSELDRKVALKLIRPDSTSSKGQMRLGREAQAMARVAHPNVIAVYDVGRVDDQVFIAMEFVDGTTLSQWARERPRTSKEVLDIFLQAGRGLAAAHAAGLVHRDFKPDNVLIGKDGRARVLDFGLARAGEPSAHVESQSPASPLGTPLTRTGALMGTPAYMPLEQLEGRMADARSDQFAFSVALYEALYRERPFIADGVDALAKQIASESVRPAPRGIRVPVRVREVLIRGLAAAPERRFASMDAFLAALTHDPARTRRRFLAGTAALLPILAGGLWLRHQVSIRASICKSAHSELAGIWDDDSRKAVRAAFAATGQPFASDASDRVARALDSYTQRWTTMQVQSCEATRVQGKQSEELLDLRTQCLDQRLSEVRTLSQLFAHATPSIVETSVSAVAKLAPLDRCAEATLLRAPMRPPNDAVRAQAQQLRTQLASSEGLRNAGRIADARARLDHIVADAHALGYAPVEAEALVLDGTFDSYPRDLKAVDRKLEDAVTAAERGRHAEALVQAWTALVANLALESRLDDAERAAGHAAAILAGFGGNPRLEAALLTNRGIAARIAGHADQAVAFHQQALELRVKTFGPDDLSVGRAANNLGSALALKGDHAAALGNFQRSLAISERVLGSANVLNVPLLNNVAIGFDAMRRPADALPYAERALHVLEDAHVADDTRVAAVLGILGQIEDDLGRSESAIEHARRALAIQEAVTPNGERVPTLLVNLGDALSTAGQLVEARDYYERALALREKLLGPDNPSLHFPLTGLGRTWLRLNRPRAALPLLQRALVLKERSFGARNAQLTDVLSALAEANLQLGRNDDARRLLDRGAQIVRTSAHRPEDQAEIDFGSALLLWNRNHEAALARAAAARTGFADSHNRRRLADVTGWIAQHHR